MTATPDKRTADTPYRGLSVRPDASRALSGHCPPNVSATFRQVVRTTAAEMSRAQLSGHCNRLSGHLSA